MTPRRCASTEKPRYQLLTAQFEMVGDIRKNCCECADAKRLVAWNGDVMLTTL